MFLCISVLWCRLVAAKKALEGRQGEQVGLHQPADMVLPDAGRWCNNLFEAAEFYQNSKQNCHSQEKKAAMQADCTKWTPHQLDYIPRFATDSLWIWASSFLTLAPIRRWSGRIQE